jgi:D-beta-D-heptose 7-phosphate kinase/D-beta-D-heptose 1-phosphate adenosyltransferase
MTESATTPQQTQFSILVIGDDCHDIYTYGYVNRISPEAPVPVFEPKYTINKDGMAGNVTNNLKALGCNVNFLHGEASKKNRLIDDRSKQQLLRIDQDEISEPLVIESLIPLYDAIVISDYNKGTVTYELVEDLRKEFTGPIFIDTKKTDLARFNGCYIKINALEKSRAVSFPDDEWLIVTHGDGGAVWNRWVFTPDKSVNVADVTGAGDTFLSALVYEYLLSNNIRLAINFANKAAGVTIQKVGVYAPRLEEIK